MTEIQTLDSKFLNINREVLQKWVVFYYINGEVVKYTSDTHNWVDLPKIGVQYLFRVYDTYKEQIGGIDFYCPYQLMDVDDIKPWVKFGSYLEDDIYNNIVWPIVRDDEINR